MPVRRFFAGETDAEHRLGRFHQGVYWIDQRLLIARVDGRPELLIEQISGIRRMPPGSASYFHLPADGLSALADISTEPVPADAPTLRDRAARLLLRLGLVPFYLFPVALLVSMVEIFTSPRSDELAARLFGSLGVLLVTSMVSHFGSIWLVARWLSEPYSAAHARLLRRWVRGVRPMGTYQGQFGRRRDPSTRALLHVMHAHDGIYIGRTRLMRLTFGVGGRFIPRAHLAQLQEVLREAQKQQANQAESQP